MMLYLYTLPFYNFPRSNFIGGCISLVSKIMGCKKEVPEKEGMYISLVKEKKKKQKKKRVFPGL